MHTRTEQKSLRTKPAVILEATHPWAPPIAFLKLTPVASIRATPITDLVTEAGFGQASTAQSVLQYFCIASGTGRKYIVTQQ